MSAEQQGSEDQGVELSLQEEYALFDFSHEPFQRYETKDQQLDRNLKYQEADQTVIREMEEAAFHPEKHFPRPPEHLGSSHPVKEAWTKLMESQEAMMNDALEIKVHHPHFNKTIEKTASERVKTLVKEKMRKHLESKKIYFHRALAYLYIYKDCEDCPANAELEDLFDKTESVFMAHMSYLSVRSATHVFKPRRDNGELVMNHVYLTCTHVINRYMEEINKEEDPSIKKTLFRKLKGAIVVALGHDYLEDFEGMTVEFLTGKLAQHMQLDTVVEHDLAILRRKEGSTIPDQTNPFTRDRILISNCLKALIKPGKTDPARNNYLIKQILNNNRLGRKGREINGRVKGGDRLNNLNTLDGAKAPERQRSYLEETLSEVVALLEKIVAKDGNTRLNQEIVCLCGTVASKAREILRKSILTEEEEDRKSVV